MAIQFARIEIVSRSKGGNACCKGAYNARGIIKDERANVVYNFARLSDNVYHAVLLPEGASPKFKDISVLMNVVESAEKQKNSQLLKDVVIALPDDKELTLQDRINLTHLIIEEMGWVREGLAVQVDIHQPHDGEKNWHAHLLVTTRRFSECGNFLAPKKARDLNPDFKTAKGRSFIIPEEEIIHEKGKRIINNYFEKLGLDNRVDFTRAVAEEHIGPVRMRRIMNEAAERNEIRKLLSLEAISSADGAIDRIVRTQSIFTKKDIELAVKEIKSKEKRQRVVEEVLSSERVMELYQLVGDYKSLEVKEEASGYFTTIEVREEEQRIMRLARSIDRLGNCLVERDKESIERRIQELEQGEQVSYGQGLALRELLLKDRGLRIMRGRAGTGKSVVLGLMRLLATEFGLRVIGLAPTNKAVSELRSKGFGVEEAFTIKGFLFRAINGRVNIGLGSLIIVDEAGMAGSSDYQELLKIAVKFKCNVVLAGDERQLAAIARGGMFEVMASEFGSYELSEIRRQRAKWGREMAGLLARGEVVEALKILEEQGGIKESENLERSIEELVGDYLGSSSKLEERLAISVRNEDVEALNLAIREGLKRKGLLQGKEYVVSVRVGKTGNEGREGIIGEEEIRDKDRDEGERRGEGIREERGKLEINNSFGVGDRILFTVTNKKAGVENGEFATLEKVSKEEFTARKDNGKVVSFNPALLRGFSYGYASTVYKAQGASIREVYVLHSKAGNRCSSYVALTRHREELKLYWNRQDSKSRADLVKALSRESDKSASLMLVSKEDIELRKERQQEGRAEEQREGEEGWIGGRWQGGKARSIIGKVLRMGNEWLKGRREEEADKLHYDKEYYEYKEEDAEIRAVEVEELHELAAEQMVAELDVEQGDGREGGKEERGEQGEIKMAVGSGAGYRGANGLTSKRYRGRADIVSREEANRETGAAVKSGLSKEEIEEVKSKAKQVVKRILLELLGARNERLSTAKVWRYGAKGSLAVSIEGEKAGIWYDFSSSKGGDLIGLVQEKRQVSFKQALEYLRQKLEGQRDELVKAVNDNEIDKIYAKFIASKFVDDGAINATNSASANATEAVKVVHSYDKLVMVKNLYQRSKELSAEAIDYAAVATIRYERGDDLAKILREETGKSLLASKGDAYARRLEEELRAIVSKGFTEELIIAANIVRICKHFGVRQVLRGSANSLLVGMGLGMHEVDPIKHGLLFERFLGNGGVPDFDFDIDSSKRFIVENYLSWQYEGRAGRLRQIQQNGKLGLHVCSNGVKKEGSGLEIKGGVFVGFLAGMEEEVMKFDLLSSRELRRLEEATRLVGLAMGDKMDIRGEDERGEARTFELIASGNIGHIFQLGGVRKDGSLRWGKLCRLLQPKNFSDLVNLSAVIRPGSKEMIGVLAGKERSNIPDPAGILAETKGAILFEEQIMKAAIEYLGIEREESNRFRKRLKAGEIRGEVREEALGRSALGSKDAAKLLEALDRASKFVYNKAHAVAYANIIYQGAYLKANYPREFEQAYRGKLEKAEIEGFIGRSYFVNWRAIKEDMPSSIRAVKVRGGEDGVHSAIAAFARDGQGNVTGCQLINLSNITGNKITGNKVEGVAGEVVKRSLGVIKGSFVEVQGAEQEEARKPSVTLIAEGLETALSLREAKVRGRILCSLGVSNIGNYEASKGERVLICADNDGEFAVSAKVVLEARSKLEDKGAIVRIVMPEQEGDYNDVLKEQGREAIREQLERSIAQLIEDDGKSRRIEKIVSKAEEEGRQKIAEEFAAKVQEVQEYVPSKVEDILSLGEGKGIEAGLQRARYVLDNINIEVETIFKVYQERVEAIKKLAPDYDLAGLREQMLKAPSLKREELLKSASLSLFKEQVEPKLTEIVREKKQARSIDEWLKIAEMEREFCLNIGREYHDLAFELGRDGNNHITHIIALYKNEPKLLDKIKQDSTSALYFNLYSQEEEILDEIKSNKHLGYAADRLFSRCYKHVYAKAASDLRYIKEKGALIKDGIEIISREEYLRYLSLDSMISPYLSESHKVEIREELSSSVKMQAIVHELLIKANEEIALSQEARGEAVEKAEEVEKARSLGLEQKTISIVEKVEQLKEEMAELGIDNAQVKKRAIGHLLEYEQLLIQPAIDGNSSNKEANKEKLRLLISRARFEEENYQKWRFYVNHVLEKQGNIEVKKEAQKEVRRERRREEQKEGIELTQRQSKEEKELAATAALTAARAAQVIETELAAERLVRMEANLLSQQNLGESRSNIADYAGYSLLRRSSRDNDKIKAAVREHYHGGRDKKIAELFASHQRVIELSKENEQAARFLAASIVDYQASYGDSSKGSSHNILEDVRLDIMQQTAIEQAKMQGIMQAKLAQVHGHADADKLSNEQTHIASEASGALENRKIMEDLAYLPEQVRSVDHSKAIEFACHTLAAKLTCQLLMHRSLTRSHAAATTHTLAEKRPELASEHRDAAAPKHPKQENEHKHLLLEEHASNCTLLTQQLQHELYKEELQQQRQQHQQKLSQSHALHIGIGF